MKTMEKETGLSIQGDAQLIKYHVSMDALGILLENTRNMYSDPYLACVREVINNAYDAHVTAGVDLPVRVSVSHDSVEIRDFGHGMDDSEIHRYIMAIGSSRSRESEDTTGGFGIGVKCLHALFKAFTYTGYKGGKMYRWYSLDSSDVPGAVKDEPVPSDEPDGFCVNLPLKSMADEDAKVFRSRIRGMVHEVAFGLNSKVSFDGKICGMPRGICHLEKNGVVIDMFENGYARPHSTYLPGEKTPVFVCPDLPSNTGAYHPISTLIGYNKAPGLIRMSGAVYQIPMDIWEDIKRVSPALEHNSYYPDHVVTITMKPGQVQPTPSRESLIINAKSRKVIIDSFVEAGKLIKAEVEKAVKQHAKDNTVPPMPVYKLFLSVFEKKGTYIPEFPVMSDCMFTRFMELNKKPYFNTTVSNPLPKLRTIKTVYRYDITGSSPLKKPTKQAFAAISKDSASFVVLYAEDQIESVAKKVFCALNTEVIEKHVSPLHRMLFPNATNLRMYVSFLDPEQYAGFMGLDEALICGVIDMREKGEFYDDYMSVYEHDKKQRRLTRKKPKQVKRKAAAFTGIQIMQYNGDTYKGFDPEGRSVVVGVKSRCPGQGQQDSVTCTGVAGIIGMLDDKVPAKSLRKPSRRFMEGLKNEPEIEHVCVFPEDVDRIKAVSGYNIIDRVTLAHDLIDAYCSLPETRAVYKELLRILAERTILGKSVIYRLLTITKGVKVSKAMQEFLDRHRTMPRPEHAILQGIIDKACKLQDTVNFNKTTVDMFPIASFAATSLSPVGYRRMRDMTSMEQVVDAFMEVVGGNTISSRFTKSFRDISTPLEQFNIRLFGFRSSHDMLLVKTATGMEDTNESINDVIRDLLT